ncbi:protein REBELOTE-like [Actinidia eriantha]|uniref:protein REBELOTE-like n=1 Tax=Actinidia eriantha TaxID=165200 RepID=UPI002584F11A|nr:protein REBELOTE-like [Actinidia eriantha]XP_057487495.1 protein REBELOTE-like [Actinidia eriantha]
MGKLGKKARKFAKKNLQSVLRQRRKTKPVFKKRSSSKGQQDIKDQVGNTAVLPKGRDPVGEEFEDISLDEIFTEGDSDATTDASESDEYLSEDESCPDVAESQNEIKLEDNSDLMVSVHNSKVNEEIVVLKKKLNKLKEKDPEFVKFLSSYKKGHEVFQNEVMDSDDETTNYSMQLVDEDRSVTKKSKMLTSSVINSWHQLVKEEHNESALINLLNGYRAACHYGTESIGVPETGPCQRIQNSETFCSILMFMLREADNIFRGLLKIPPSCCKKETLVELYNTSKWKSLKPLIKSYLRSTLFLLNQVTNAEILAFSLSRLKVSIIFFAAFPSLLRRLIKVAVHLWVSSEGVLSSCSFRIIQSVAVVFSSECFDICLIRTYKAYIGHSKVVDIINAKHMQFLRNSFVEICSSDVHKSCTKALLSIQQLAKILKQGLVTKKKEALKKICSWQYANCIDLWVRFISANIRDYDLHHVFYPIIQLINGVACLFPGPRYYPLRLKCIQWLNHLSSSSGIFIPVASFVLDVLEYKMGKEGGKPGDAGNISSVLKLPKHWLKSRNFREECVASAVELLSAHFSHWSYHISFPELVTIPLIRLRKFHEITTTESLRRVVKRLIDQMEQNVEFVQKKRDEVSFSPKDHQSVESFLQLEKGSLNAPFTQYYRSVLQNALTRNLDKNGIRSSLEQKKTKRKRGLPCKAVTVSVNSEQDLGIGSLSVNGGRDNSKRQKRS